MPWRLSHRADPEACAIADRHYNRQHIGSPQCAPPGRCLVLVADKGSAFWITSWPFAEYVKHAWAGAWVCSAFRSEGAGRASDLITAAISATRAFFGEPPTLGMVTFINTEKVRPVKQRGVSLWGYSWLKAGFQADGQTKGGLLAFRLPPERMPEACAALPKRPIALPLFDAALARRHGGGT